MSSPVFSEPPGADCCVCCGAERDLVYLRRHDSGGFVQCGPVPVCQNCKRHALIPGSHGGNNSGGGNEDKRYFCVVCRTYLGEEAQAFDYTVVASADKRARIRQGSFSQSRQPQKDEGDAIDAPVLPPPVHLPQKPSVFVKACSQDSGAVDELMEDEQEVTSHAAGRRGEDVQEGTNTFVTTNKTKTKEEIGATSMLFPSDLQSRFSLAAALSPRGHQDQRQNKSGSLGVPIQPQQHPTDAGGAVHKNRQDIKRPTNVFSSSGGDARASSSSHSSHSFGTGTGDLQEVEQRQRQGFLIDAGDLTNSFMGPGGNINRASLGSAPSLFGGITPIKAEGSFLLNRSTMISEVGILDDVEALLEDVVQELEASGGTGRRNDLLHTDQIEEVVELEEGRAFDKIKIMPEEERKRDQQAADAQHRPASDPEINQVLARKIATSYFTGQVINLNKLGDDDGVIDEEESVSDVQLELPANGARNSGLPSLQVTVTSFDSGQIDEAQGTNFCTNKRRNADDRDHSSPSQEHQVAGMFLDNAPDLPAKRMRVLSSDDFVSTQTIGKRNLASGARAEKLDGEPSGVLLILSFTCFCYFVLFCDEDDVDVDKSIPQKYIILALLVLAERNLSKARPPGSGYMTPKNNAITKHEKESPMFHNNQAHCPCGRASRQV